MLLKVTQPTILKIHPVQSAELQPGEKISVDAGWEAPIDAYKAEKGHFRITLGKDQDGDRISLIPTGGIPRNTWYTFQDHVQIVSKNGQNVAGNIGRSIKLPVPYYSQRDNQHQWWRTCNSSAHAMLLNFLKPGSVASDDEYWAKYVNPVGDSIEWSVHSQALQRFGIESVFRQNLGFDDLNRSLERGCPIAIGVAHRGTLAAPTGEHVCLVVGREKNDYLVHDPWGYGFAYVNHNGAYARYPISSLHRRWECDGINTGWGRLITAIDGKRTGL